MESKLNIEAVKEYSAAFAVATADQAFAQQDKVEGHQIISLTPVKQINLFVINDLLNKWKEETLKIRSPYFDYEAVEVKEALQEFMNVLSQHIAVSRDYLVPLVESATFNTLILLLDPRYFYRQVLSDVQYSLNRENLKELFKYTKINRSFPDMLLQHMEKEKKHEIHASYALWLLDEKADQFTESQSEVKEIMSSFSQTKSINQNTFYTRPSSENLVPVTSTSSFENKSVEIDQGPKTLNDYLNKASGTSLADIHLKKKISNLKSHISVNQRYMFVRELFDNNNEDYSRALTELEQHQTYVEAFNYLRNEFAQKYRWRMDSEEVVEFLEVISKRYQ